MIGPGAGPTSLLDLSVNPVSDHLEGEWISPVTTESTVKQRPVSLWLCEMKLFSDRTNPPTESNFHLLNKGRFPTP